MNQRDTLTLKSWLDSATQGLTAADEKSVRAELQAHFEDAVEQHKKSGEKPDDAVRLALADLGAAEAIDRGLLDVHRGQRLYPIAMALSMLNLLTNMVMPVLHESMSLEPGKLGETLFVAGSNIALFGPTCIVIYILGKLIEWRSGDNSASKAVRVIMAGVIGYLTIDTLMLAMFGYSNIYFLGKSVGETQSGLELAMYLLSSIGQLVTGAALAVLAWVMYQVRGHLFGLALPISVMANLLALSVIVTALTQAAGQTNIFIVFAIAGNMIHFFIWPTFTLLFFRAIYRPASLPVRLA
jgi:hypothetical protein